MGKERAVCGTENCNVPKFEEVAYAGTLTNRIYVNDNSLGVSLIEYLWKITCEMLLFILLSYLLIIKI